MDVERTLPKRAVVRIAQLTSKKQTESYLNLYYFLFVKCDKHNWTTISKNSFRTAKHRHHQQKIKNLDRWGLLTVDHRYTRPTENKQGECKKYTIPKHVYEESEPIKFDNCDLSELVKTHRTTDQLEIDTKKALRKLRWNRRGIWKRLVNEISPEYIRKQIDTNLVEGGTYKVVHYNKNLEPIPTKKDYYNTVANITDWTCGSCDMFVYKNTLCVLPMDYYLEDFVRKVRWAKIWSYYHRAERFEELVRTNRPNRNSNNYRLNHLLTNFPSMLRKELKFGKARTCQFDLANSQFAIASALMRRPFLYDAIHNKLKGDDLERADNYKAALLKGYEAIKDLPQSNFHKDVATGELYDKFAKRSRISRKQAKQLFFSICFGARPKHPLKHIIINQYNDFWVFSQTIKKELKSKDFPIALQILESIIFVDSILGYIHKSDITTDVLTIHDSIMCKESNSKRIEKVMRHRLDWFLGADSYTLKKE